jgi:hypothetical protein
MSNKSIATIDIDNNSFHVVGLDQRGAIVLQGSGLASGCAFS